MRMLISSSKTTTHTHTHSKTHSHTHTHTHTQRHTHTHTHTHTQRHTHTHTHTHTLTQTKKQTTKTHTSTLMKYTLTILMTNDQHFILHTLYSHFHIIRKKNKYTHKKKPFIIILQNYVTSHSVSNFTNLCNARQFFFSFFSSQLIRNLHTTTLRHSSRQPPVLRFVQFTIVAVTHPSKQTKNKNKKRLYAK